MKPKKLLIYSVFFNDNVGVLFLCGWLTVSQLTSSPRSAEISSSSSLQRTKNVIIKKKFNHCFGHWSLLLSFCLLLSEDSQDKVGLFAGLKGGGNDDVLSGRKTQPGADFSQVNESLRACARWMAQKEIFLQVDILAASVLWVVMITDVLKRICLLELNTNTGACAVQPTSSGTCKNEKIKMFTPRGKNLLNSKVVSNWER